VPLKNLAIPANNYLKVTNTKALVGIKLPVHLVITVCQCEESKIQMFGKDQEGDKC